MSPRYIPLQVGQVSTPTANVAQALQKTTEANKIDDVVLLLYEEMQQADTNGHRMPLTIVFVERKLRADQVAEALRAETISAAALHGGLSQVPHGFAAIKWAQSMAPNTWHAKLPSMMGELAYTRPQYCVMFVDSGVPVRSLSDSQRWPSSRPAASVSSSRQTLRRAGWTSRASATSSTPTCRRPLRTTSTG
jgi:hypothetical protein